MELMIAYYAFAVIGIIKKKSKPLTILMMTIMWVVMSLNTYNGDFENYKWVYQNIQNPSFWTEYELLFNSLMYLCRVAGFSFIQFKMVFGGIYVILLDYVAVKFTENDAEVLGLYMLFPFMFFVVVIRSGFAGLFVILAFYNIMGENDNRHKFWLFMLIAFLLQYTSIFFLLFYYLRLKNFKRNSLLITSSLVVVAFITYYTGLLYRIVSLITSNYRTLKWFMPNHSGQAVRWVMYLVIIDLVMIFLAYLSYYENRNTIHAAKITNPFAVDNYYFNISALVFVPTFFVTNAAARFIWELLLLNILCYSKDEEQKDSVRRKHILYFKKKTLLLIIILIGFGVYANLPYKGTVNDMNLIFQNNLLFGASY